MTPEYLDFELEIGLGQGRDYPVAVLRSPAGEARATMHLPFDELALERHLDKLQIALLRSGGRRRRALTQEQQDVQDFGQLLFDALMTGDIRSRYDVSQISAGEMGLRLKLRIADPKLAVLPWEFLYDSRRAEYICLSRHTPIVRYVELPQPPGVLTIEPPLRILGMIASPSDAVTLDVESERQRVEQALAGLIEKGLVELEWLAGQTWRDLQKAMRGGPWHIFHFVGHGAFDANADEGLVLFCDDQGKARRFRATDLGRMLADHRTLRLVFLNACEGARGSERDIFSSTASILVRNRIPAVLAMQYEITDRAAVELSRAFYESLVEGLPVDAAVAEARKAVSWAVTNTVEWGTPVLYMRAPDGMLFELGDAAPPAKPAPQPLELPVPARSSQAPASNADSKQANGTSDQVLMITEPLHMEFVRVPAGEFLMGSDPAKDEGAYGGEQPQHTVGLDAYTIGKYPVTNAQYAVFVKAAKAIPPKHWWGGAVPKGKEDHPVVNVSWHDAWAFCDWLRTSTRKPFRLPSEAEWEKAARATDGRLYPWGDSVPNTSRCNFSKNIGDTTPVGQYPDGAGPYGALDMSGNVWEWTNSRFKGYQYDPKDGREVRYPSGERVLRGASFVSLARDVRCAYRLSGVPDVQSGNFGFRVCISPGV